MAAEPEAATAPEVEAHPQRRAFALLGVAYFATLGVVMTLWVGGLIWAAFSVVEWLVS